MVKWVKWGSKSCHVHFYTWNLDFYVCVFSSVISLGGAALFENLMPFSKKKKRWWINSGICPMHGSEQPHWHSKNGRWFPPDFFWIPAIYTDSFVKVWSLTKITKPSGTQISCTPWICWKWTQLLSFWACLPSRSWKDLHAKNPMRADPARSEAQWYLKKIQPSVLKSLTAFHCIIIWKYLEYQKNQNEKLW